MASGKKANARRTKARHRRQTTHTNDSYVKWLGAGAVTVGLGAAMATGQGLVLAAPASADESTSTESSSNDTAAEPSTDASVSDPSGTETNSKPEPAKSTVSASTVEITKDDDADEDPSIPEAEAAIEEPVVDEESGDEDTAVVDPEPTATPVPESTQVTDSPTVAAVETGSDYSTGMPAAVPNGTSSVEAIEMSSAAKETSTTTSFTAAIATVPDVDALSVSTTSMAVTALAAVTAEPVHEPAFLQGPITLRSIVSDVLVWLGLSEFASTHPAPAQPLPPLVESLWLMMRRFQYTFNNDRPIASPTISGQNPLTGVITGQLNATDYDDDHLTYTVTGNPANGMVTVDAAGNFVYTPTAAFAETGGQDQFTVSIDDRAGKPWHIHGPLDLFGLVAPTTAIVRVTVVPINHLPAVSITQTGQPNPASGAIAYQVQITDPDTGDNHVVAITDAPDHGTLVRNIDGTYTYTPDYDYAHANPMGATDSFTVTVDDGRGGIAGDTEHIAVPFLNVAPAGTAVVGQPDPETGTVTGGFMVGDAPDGDPLTYTLTSGGAKADSITVDPDTGAWSYTPVEAARIAAAAANASVADKQDTFVVTVSDGYAETQVVVTVPIAPPHNSVIAAITVGDRPNSVTVSPDGAYVYVTHADGTIGNGTVSVIDTATNTVLTTITVGDDPTSVAFTPDSAHAYVTNVDSGTVSVIDTATHTVVATIPVGHHPTSVEFSPDGAHAYVTNDGSGTVSVIDTATHTVVATIPVGDQPFDVAVSPDGTYLYVTHYVDDMVSVIDILTSTVTTTVDVGDRPWNVAASPDGTSLYVTHNAVGDDAVFVIDAVTNTVTTTIDVGGDPFGVAFSPAGTNAYVTNHLDDCLSVIDTVTHTVVATIDVGAFPRAVAVSQDGTHIYVANQNDGTVSVISVVPTVASVDSA
jgi:YVTN family beta-propeller protein/VCBS repeat-containing protein